MKIYCEVEIKDRTPSSVLDAIAYASRHEEVTRGHREDSGACFPRAVAFCAHRRPPEIHSHGFRHN